MPGTIYTTAPNSAAIVTFAKIEPRAIDINLTATMQVKVHDALWMLTQQWRMGEFKGMDGGSAIRAKVNTKSSLINRFKPHKSTNAIEYTHGTPLEAMVESLPLNPDLLLRAQMGRYFLKLLKSMQLDTTDFFAEFKVGFPITLPGSTDDYTKSNDELMGLLSIFDHMALDGHALYLFIANGSGPLFSPGPNNLLGGSAIISAQQKLNIQGACTKFVQWYRRTYNIPDSASQTSWSESSLDYRFKVSTPVDNTSNSSQVVMHTDSYKNGDLDWHDFDLSNTVNESLTETGTPISNTQIGGNGEAIIQTKTTSYIPSAIDFKGMPVARWWEFEYASLDIGAMTVNKQDMLKMMVSNFGLIYSNDWLIVPLKVRAGSLCEIKNFLVTDVFGKHTLVKPAGSGMDNNWQRWAMYNLNKKGEAPVPGDIRLLLPPVIINRAESEPVERVVFLKDEMANMVWGIEEIIPDGIIGGKEGKLAELALHNYYIRINKYTANPPTINANDSQIAFRLANALPENWIPFIPVRDTAPADGRSIKYRRGTFKRVVNNINTNVSVTPRSNTLMPNGSSAYYLNEEEILKPGTIISTTYQRTRWYNGEVVTWMGRNRKNGRGEGRSGLKFDQIVPEE